MNREQLQRVQTPIKARYRRILRPLWITLRAEGVLYAVGHHLLGGHRARAGRGRPTPRHRRRWPAGRPAGYTFLQALVACARAGSR